LISSQMNASRNRQFEEKLSLYNLGIILRREARVHRML
jgi:hypothetical protein